MAENSSDWREIAYQRMIWDVIDSIDRLRRRTGVLELSPLEVEATGGGYVKLGDEDTLALVRMWILGRELLEEIVPKILRRLSFEEDEQEVAVSRGPLRGRIIWGRTISARRRRPRVVYTVVPRRRLLTPENLLMVRSILEVRSLAQRVIDRAGAVGVTVAGGGSAFGGEVVRRAELLRDSAERLLRTPALREVVREASARSLAEILDEASGPYGVSHLYFPLIGWAEKFLSDVVTKLGKRRLEDVLERLVKLKPDPDRLFEVYAFLLLVEAALSLGRVSEVDLSERIARIMVGELLLEVRGKGVPEGVEERSWLADQAPKSLITGREVGAPLTGIPDLWIGVRMDSSENWTFVECKFSRSGGYLRSSVWKVLGYMESFQVSGVLAFPGVETGDSRDESAVLEILRSAKEEGGLFFEDERRGRLFLIIRLDPLIGYQKNLEIVNYLMDQLLRGSLARRQGSLGTRARSL